MSTGSRLARNCRRVDVDDVGQAMEGEEGDSERKRDTGLRAANPSGAKSAARLAVTKFAYLKIARMMRLPATAPASASRRAAPSRSSMISAAKKLKTIEKTRTRMKRGSPQA